MKKKNEESARYIADMSKQLAELARQNEFMDAAVLLQMVHLEISQQFESSLRGLLSKNCEAAGVPHCRERRSGFLSEAVS